MRVASTLKHKNQAWAQKLLSRFLRRKGIKLLNSSDRIHTYNARDNYITAVVRAVESKCSLRWLGCHYSGNDRYAHQEALESDDGLARWIAATFEPGTPNVFVRASTYKVVRWEQEIRKLNRWNELTNTLEFDRSDPRRPVFMLGALALLKEHAPRRGPNQGSWGQALFCRFLRRKGIKFLGETRRGGYFFDVPNAHMGAIKRAVMLKCGTRLADYYYGNENVPVLDQTHVANWAVKLLGQVEHRAKPTPTPSHTPHQDIDITTRKRRERAILRAVHELGLIDIGEPL